MAKGILEFDLNDQDEVMAHKRCIKSLDLILTLWDLDQSLRSKTKYAPDSLPQDKYDAYQEIREELRELMLNHNVSFDELIN